MCVVGGCHAHTIHTHTRTQCFTMFECSFVTMHVPNMQNCEANVPSDGSMRYAHRQWDMVTPVTMQFAFVSVNCTRIIHENFSNGLRETITLTLWPCAQSRQSGNLTLWWICKLHTESRINVNSELWNGFTWFSWVARSENFRVQTWVQEKFEESLHVRWRRSFYMSNLIWRLSEANKKLTLSMRTNIQNWDAAVPQQDVFSCLHVRNFIQFRYYFPISPELKLVQIKYFRRTNAIWIWIGA